jgi:hypothetical protein
VSSARCVVSNGGGGDRGEDAACDSFLHRRAAFDDPSPRGKAGIGELRPSVRAPRGRSYVERNELSKEREPPLRARRWKGRLGVCNARLGSSSAAVTGARCPSSVRPGSASTMRRSPTSSPSSTPSWPAPIARGAKRGDGGNLRANKLKTLTRELLRKLPRLKGRCSMAQTAFDVFGAGRPRINLSSHSSAVPAPYDRRQGGSER